MKQLTCEMCGSTEILKQDGVFMCQVCGTKYSLEEAKKMMIEGTVDVKGTVTINNSANLENFVKRAISFIQKGEWNSATEYMNKILDIDADNIDARILGLLIQKRYSPENSSKMFSAFLYFSGEGETIYQNATGIMNEFLKSLVKPFVELKEGEVAPDGKWILGANEKRYYVNQTMKATFCDCEGLTSVEIPDSVTSIGNYAFYGCENLTRVKIPDSVTSIGDSAFYKCNNLTSITIPNGVTSISEQAFRECSSLTNVTIPDSVTSIGYSAFKGCSSLTNVTIPDSVTSIGDFAFKGCSSLTDITLPNGLRSIADFAFEGCSSLTDITLPNGLRRIDSCAFSGCSSLTNVTIPDSVTSIGDSAFKGCSSLTNVTIPDSVTSIGDFAFKGCSSLTNVTIPDSVTSISDTAFYKCNNLTSATIPNSVDVIRALPASIKIHTKATTPQSTKPQNITPQTTNTTGGCYIATCVYGSYDCPQVWTLRRYRDDTLGSTWHGRSFIKMYYAISPTLVKWFGNTTWFKKLWKGKLDRMVKKLQNKGVESTPYKDKGWKK